ncbi:MAG: hypothetical protein JWO90_1537 [Solirubrobacterales bacterium]|jgi:hypothetical protein|nr:hypothetical protein [Solirubrobacterales bacterium]
MPKLPIRGTPWLLVIQAALAARDHWSVLTPEERTDLARLLRATRGRPSNLTAREKAELRRLVGRLDLPGLGKDLLPLARKKRGRR